MRERIAQFLSYNPRNKVIFVASLDSHLKSVDMGFELASRIKSHLSSPHLSMIAQDCVSAILKANKLTDDVIGEYVAISNWGILFEPDLKFDILSLFENYSKNSSLILVNCGQADSEYFHLVSKHFNKNIPLGSLAPYIIQ